MRRYESYPAEADPRQIAAWDVLDGESTFEQRGIAMAVLREFVPFEDWQVVAHRLGQSSKGYLHGIVYRHQGLSALNRAAWCGGLRAGIHNSAYPPGWISWYPEDDGEFDVATALIVADEQGNYVCKRCLERAVRMQLATVKEAL